MQCSNMFCNGIFTNTKVLAVETALCKRLYLAENKMFSMIKVAPILWESLTNTWVILENQEYSKFL